MHIVQVLPELNSGGVERGTVEFSRYLVNRGHQSTVISNGGLLVEQLLDEGGRHIAFPVHKKSLLSLRFVRPLRKLLLDLNADVVHIRSRMPAWLVWLAIGKLPKAKRPAIVSTFHGLYSSNRYSEIMGCGDQVIAISQCVYDYIREHYPRIDKDKVSIVHRGVDSTVFHPGIQLEQQWISTFFSRYPQLKGKSIVLFPGRLTEWKGHKDFLNIMSHLNSADNIHGVIVGHVDPKKQHYKNELQELVGQLSLNDTVSFIDALPDIEKLYTLAKVVCNFSVRPEPFGRTVIEALACGTPVVAYNTGGPGESLGMCLPEGLVQPSDYQAAATAIDRFCQQPATIEFPEIFTLDYQAQNTLNIYQQALD